MGRAPLGAARTAVGNHAAPTELWFELYIHFYKHHAPNGAKSRISVSEARTSGRAEPNDE